MRRAVSARGAAGNAAWRRFRALLVAAAVVLCMAAMGAPAAPGGQAAGRAAGSRVPVTRCRLQPEPFFPRAEPAVPSSVVLPPPVTLPPGAVVYGVAQPFTSAVRFSIAPAGFDCSAVGGVDGDFEVSLSAPGAPAPSVSYSYSVGGADFAVAVACPYIPAAAAAEAALPYGGPCTVPGGVAVSQVATGSPRLQAATIVDPPGMPLLGGVSDSPAGEQAVNVMVNDEDATQVASCALPAGQWQVCAAGLGYFAAQSMAASAGPATVAAIQAAVDETGTGTGASGGKAAGGDCRAPADVTLEREIAESAGQPIAVPGEVIGLPRLYGQVSVSLVPGEVAVCDSGLTASLATPGGFDDGDMSLSAAIPGAGTRGPFTYSAASAAWTSVPGAPPGQRLATRFDPASAEASAGASLSLALTLPEGELAPSLDIAHVSISAVRQDITLIGPPGPVLRAALGPTLVISAGITVKAVEGAVEEQASEEEEGTGPGSAEAVVADRVGGDAVDAIDQAALEFYGLEIPAGVNARLSAELVPGLLGLLEADPVLAAFDPAGAPTVDGQAPPGSDPAAIDSAEGVPADDVGGLGFLEDLLLLP